MVNLKAQIWVPPLNDCIKINNMEAKNWVPLANDCIKINTEAQVDWGKFKIGIGVIARDELRELKESKMDCVGRGKEPSTYPRIS
ncbi:hypothetical protein ACH5RR_023149 [Cinchona calisaya]|uniref:DUF4283 domain-containing protein n=1 Tax=Cinchona calisaya TaxID=153742 RepID=A0ABD2ZD04_9GENT